MDNYSGKQHICRAAAPAEYWSPGKTLCLKITISPINIHQVSDYPRTFVELNQHNERRYTIFSHKICLTGGASNLILDCLIVQGNPANTNLAIPMLDRQKQIYGRYPLKVGFDSGFASKDNLKQAKAVPRKIKDVFFAKKRGLDETDMCRREYVYHRLRRFSAGIESGISWLKRCMGLSRCMWKGGYAFKSYVWSSIVTANLMTIARAKLAKI